MAAASPTNSRPLLLGRCANCLIFGWKPAPLQQCSRCKVLQYCSKTCQKEHLKLVHKQHCRELASAKNGEGGDTLGIFSHHPFSDAKLSDDPVEAMVMLLQKILQKIRSSKQPAFTKVQSQLLQLGEAMKKWREEIWADKKLYPGGPKDYDVSSCTKLFFEMAYIEDEDLVRQDLWRILHLVMGKLLDYQNVLWLNGLKNPRETVPAELWIGLEQEVGPFPSRVTELIKALSSTQLPSFQELLKVVCGGSLLQACSVCNTTISVAAVWGEAEGAYIGTSSVLLLPHLPPLFNCSASTCEVAIIAKIKVHDKWRAGVGATYAKLWPNKCDYCFQLPEKVHRCKSCLTKTYCSKDCLVKDWEEKHKELCKESLEEWKKKKGAEARVETGLKGLEDRFKLIKGPDMKPEDVQYLIEAKEMCEKMGSAGNAGKGLKHKKDGVKGDSKEQRKKQEEPCIEVKLGASKMTMSEMVKVEMMEMKKSGQKLGSSGKAERSVKKGRGKGGELAEVEKKVRGKRESVSEVD